MAWVSGVLLTALYLVGGITVTRLPATIWAVLFVANLVIGFCFFQFLMRFNLAEHERRSWGLTGMALELLTAPVYVTAAAGQLAGRSLTYVVTAKGSAATGDTWRTFRPHAGWAAVAMAGMVTGPLLHHNYPSLYLWAGLTLVICLAPMASLFTGTGARAAVTTTTLPARLYPVATQRRIGDILLDQGLIDRQDLQALLDLQASSEGPWQRPGDLAVIGGHVTVEQLTAAILVDALSTSPGIRRAA